MSFWSRNSRPRPEDYNSDEEYENALAAYEDAEYWAIEEAEQDY